jgi:hypothetical protein
LLRIFFISANSAKQYKGRACSPAAPTSISSITHSVPEKTSYLPVPTDKNFSLPKWIQIGLETHGLIQ